MGYHKYLQSEQLIIFAWIFASLGTIYLHSYINLPTYIINALIYQITVFFTT